MRDFRSMDSNVKIGDHTRPPRYCESCESSHIGVVPCGLTWLERMRSHSLSPDATPSRRGAGFYDEDAITNIFGADAEERMMEETEGVGYCTPEEFAALSPDMQQDVAAFYGADPEDSKVIAGG